jgi:hypothetical protein
MPRIVRTLALTGPLFGTLFLAWSVAGAQTAPVRVPNSTQHPHQEPCWQQAGITKSVMEQRRIIAQNARSQVQSVCADSALTVSQKHEKIRQIREQARTQEERLVTPEQMQALHACQASRTHSSTGVHLGSGRAGAGPCGDLPANSAPNGGSGKKPEPENEPEN